MKNVVIVVVVIAATAAAGVWLAPRSLEENSISPGPGGVIDTDELAAVTAAKHKQSELDLEKRLPVPSKTGPWPKAVVEETSYEFGSMQVGAELEHVFVIRNEGDAPLNLLEGKSTCKCTGFTLSQRQLQTGEAAELKVRWIGKFRDANFRHGGPVYTDDPERQKISFAVIGNVDNAIEILPADIWSVGPLAPEQTGSITAHLISRIHEDFQVLSAEPKSSFVSVDVSPLTKEAIKDLDLDAVSGYALHVEISPEIPPGPFESPIELQIDRVDKPSTVNVTATKAGPIEIQQSPGVLWLPSANGLKLGQFSAQKGREVELILMVNEEKLEGELKLKKTTAVPSVLETELRLLRKIDGNKGRYGLKVRVPPGIQKCAYDRHKPAKLILETNHPGNPVITINVSFKAF